MNIDSNTQKAVQEKELLILQKRFDSETVKNTTLNLYRHITEQQRKDIADL